VEVQRGWVLSEPLPLLVLPCAAAVAEVRQLEAGQGAAGGVPDPPAFLRQVGLVVQYLYRHQLEQAGLAVPPYPPAVVASLARTARHADGVAAARGWSALRALLQPALSGAGEPTAAPAGASPNPPGARPSPGALPALAAAAGRPEAEPSPAAAAQLAVQPAWLCGSATAAEHGRWDAEPLPRSDSAASSGTGMLHAGCSTSTSYGG
jgi:hypothetical protein